MTDRGSIASRMTPTPAPRDRVKWTCEVSGPGLHADLPPGADLPMRQAVRAAFLEIVGVEPDELASGWGESPSLQPATVADVQAVAERLELVYVPEQHRLHAAPKEQCNVDSSMTKTKIPEEKLSSVSPDVKLCDHCVSPEEARIIRAGLRRP